LVIVRKEVLRIRRIYMSVKTTTHTVIYYNYNITIYR
jgi:hypothetical protein